MSWAGNDTTSGELLGRIHRSIHSDPRIFAAWLAGSRGRGTSDDLSDIDIWLAVEDDAIVEINADPLAFVHSIASTLMHIQAPSIAPPGGVFLLTWLAVREGFEQVDWYWMPASTASRPAQTQLLFARGPVPVVDASEPDRLEGDAFTQEIDGTISDALLLIAYAWKHARRGHIWQMLNSIRHTDEVLAKLDWLIAYGHPPAFDDPVRSFLPDAIPVGIESQRVALQAMVNTLELLARDAGRRASFVNAMSALSATLDP